MSSIFHVVIMELCLFPSILFAQFFVAFSPLIRFSVKPGCYFQLRLENNMCVKNKQK